MLRDNQEPIVILALAGIFQLAFVIEGSPLLGPMISSFHFLPRLQEETSESKGCSAG
jgi:hypothetical protein